MLDWTRRFKILCLSSLLEALLGDFCEQKTKVELESVPRQTKATVKPELIFE